MREVRLGIVVLTAAALLAAPVWLSAQEREREQPSEQGGARGEAWSPDCSESESWEAWGECWGRWGEAFGERWGRIGEAMGEHWGSFGEEMGESWGSQGEEWGERWGSFGEEWGEHWGSFGAELGASSRKRSATSTGTRFPGLWRSH